MTIATNSLEAAQVPVNIGFDPLVLFDPMALAIVLGGTIVSVLLRHRLQDIWIGLGALRTLARRPLDSMPMREQIAALERIAVRHGLVALNRSVIADGDMAAAVAAAAEGASPSEIERIVTQSIANRAERHRTGIELWAGVAEVAPAMGLIGTIFGLVRMFAQMQDADQLGGAMAVALLATLYGALLANLVALPIVARLKRLARVETAQRMRLVGPLARLGTLERGRKKDKAA